MSPFGNRKSIKVCLAFLTSFRLTGNPGFIVQDKQGSIKINSMLQIDHNAAAAEIEIGDPLLRDEVKASKDWRVSSFLLPPVV